MKYKKVLFVTTRYPFPVTGGDKLRISEIMKFLSNRNKIDLVSIGKSQRKIKFIRKQFIFKNNIFSKTLNLIKSLVNGEPLQVGLYKSPKMKNEINKICKNYDVIIFHLIRSTYYMPNKFKGQKILEMTDLISKNYETVEQHLSFINPLKYLYKFEKKRLNKYEIREVKKFDKIVLVNRGDLKYSGISKKNILIIGNGTHFKKNIYFKNQKKNNIIFFGNINSLANRSACLDFINNYLPTLRIRFPAIKFRILGNCSSILKIFFKLRGIDIISNIGSLKNYSMNSLAGICNVKIQSGLQNKILDYTSIGLPIIINKTSNNFRFLKGKNILEFTNKSEFFSFIYKLNTNINLRKKISLSNHRKTKKFYLWNKVLSDYKKLIK